MIAKKSRNSEVNIRPYRDNQWPWAVQKQYARRARGGGAGWDSFDPFRNPVIYSATCVFLHIEHLRLQDRCSTEGTLH
jgi:hypothetical protein